MKKYEGTIELKLYGLLIVGIGVIGYVAAQLPQVLVFKSSLTAIHGTLYSGDILANTKIDRKGHRYKEWELVFFLRESEKEFRVPSNLGDHDKILKGLNRSTSLIVWVKTSALSERSPKVYQIERDGKYMLLEFIEVRDKERPMLGFLLVLGLSMILFFVWMKYPEKLKRIFSD